MPSQSLPEDLQTSGQNPLYGTSEQNIRAQTSMGMRHHPQYQQSVAAKRRSQPKRGTSKASSGNHHYESSQEINIQHSQSNSYLTNVNSSKLGAGAVGGIGQQYTNTQYYIQHGSSILNKSLKGQIVRVKSSSTYSQKQRRNINSENQRIRT